MTKCSQLKDWDSLYLSGLCSVSTLMQNLPSAHRTAFYNTANIWMTLKKNLWIGFHSTFVFDSQNIWPDALDRNYTSMLHFDFTLNFNTVQVGWRRLFSLDPVLTCQYPLAKLRVENHSPWVWLVRVSSILDRGKALHQLRLHGTVFPASGTNL